MNALDEPPGQIAQQASAPNDLGLAAAAGQQLVDQFSAADFVGGPWPVKTR